MKNKARAARVTLRKNGKWYPENFIFLQGGGAGSFPTRDDLDIRGQLFELFKYTGNFHRFIEKMVCIYFNLETTKLN